MTYTPTYAQRITLERICMTAGGLKKILDPPGSSIKALLDNKLITLDPKTQHYFETPAGRKALKQK